MKQLDRCFYSEILNHAGHSYNDTLFKALKKIEDPMSVKSIQAREDYATIDGLYKNPQMYDGYSDRIMPENEWSDVVGDEHRAQLDEEKKLLEKAGLWKAFESVMNWLWANDHIYIEVFRDFPRAKDDNNVLWEERDLSYGCQLMGFHRMEDEKILWEVHVFDRPIKERDVLRGADTAYLLYDGKKDLMYNVSASFWGDDETGITEIKYKEIFMGTREKI